MTAQLLPLVSLRLLDSHFHFVHPTDLGDELECSPVSATVLQTGFKQHVSSRQLFCKRNHFFHRCRQCRPELNAPGAQLRVQKWRNAKQFDCL